jgi:putative transcriptional regulator
MKKQHFEELKSSMIEALSHARGKLTLKTKDVPLPSQVEEFRPQEIARLRQRLNASQGVFARWLNVSRDTAISWETGRRKPSGAALRLLQLLQIDPEVVPRMAALTANKKRSRF